MSNEGVTLKEFVAIMLAAAMITTALYKTHPTKASRETAPLMLGQFSAQFGDKELPDHREPNVWDAKDPFFTEHVAPPDSANPGWSSGFSNAWTRATSWLSGMFGGIGRWLNPENPY